MTWLCHSCMEPGVILERFRRYDHGWHRGVVRKREPFKLDPAAEAARKAGKPLPLNEDKSEAIVEVLYDDGSDERLNLLTEKFRVVEHTDLNEQLTAQSYHDDPHVYVNLIDVITPVPKTHRDIMQKLPTHYKELWLASEAKEFDTVVRKGTIKLVDLKHVPRDAIITPSKWVYKLKSDGTLKSRWCLLGNLMPKDEDINSCPTPRLSSVRMLLSVAAREDLEFHVWDIESAFLEAQPKGATYIRFPPGRDQKGKVGLLCRNLYGSLWGPLLFSNVLYNWLTSRGFTTNPHDPCIYVRREQGKHPTRVCAHVDDLGVCAPLGQVQNLKKQITQPGGFVIVDSGPLGKKPDLDINGKPVPGTGAERYLGIEVERDEEGFHLYNRHLIDTLVHRAEPYMKNTKSVDVPIEEKRLLNARKVTDPKERKACIHKGHRLEDLPYRSFLGASGYIMLATKPGLAYSYKEHARFGTNYGPEHWDSLLEMISWIKRTRNEELLISRHGDGRLTAYCDADWNGNSDHVSTTGWIIFCGSSPIQWCSQSQKSTAKSVCESEYLSLSHLSQELVYLQMLANSLYGHRESSPIYTNQGTDGEDRALKVWRKYEEMCDADGTPIHPATAYSDSANAIANARTAFGWLNEKLRHVKTAFHFVKQYVLPNDLGARLELRPCAPAPRNDYPNAKSSTEGAFSLEHVRGDDNPSDLMTKAYSSSKLGIGQRAKLFAKHNNFCRGLREMGQDVTFHNTRHKAKMRKATDRTSTPAPTSNKGRQKSETGAPHETSQHRHAAAAANVRVYSSDECDEA